MRELLILQIVTYPGAARREDIVDGGYTMQIKVGCPHIDALVHNSCASETLTNNMQEALQPCHVESFEVYARGWEIDCEEQLRRCVFMRGSSFLTHAPL